MTTKQAKKSRAPRKSKAQRMFEDRNPWAVGSVVDWSKLTPEQRGIWEAEAAKPPEPEVPLDQLYFEPSAPVN